VFISAQFGQGWVVEGAPAPEEIDPPGAEDEPVPDGVGAGLGPDLLFASGVADWPIGAPHVSQ